MRLLVNLLIRPNFQAPSGFCLFFRDYWKQLHLTTATRSPSVCFLFLFLLLLIIFAPRAQLYGLGYPRQPSLRATLAEATFSLFLSKIQPAVYIRIANSSRGARQLGWASCLTSAGRVTLASGTTFLHINALARLTGTSLGVANVT